MSRARANARERGYTLLVVLMTSSIILGFTVVLASLALFEWKRDRMSVLAAQAEQVLASARAWSRTHERDLAAGRAVEVPVDEILTPPVSGRATLRRVRADGMLIDVCEVRVERSSLRATRRGSWPAVHPGGGAVLALPAP